MTYFTNVQLRESSRGAGLARRRLLLFVVSAAGLLVMISQEMALEGSSLYEIGRRCLRMRNKMNTQFGEPDDVSITRIGPLEYREVDRRPVNHALPRNPGEEDFTHLRHKHTILSSAASLTWNPMADGQNNVNWTVVNIRQGRHLAHSRSIAILGSHENKTSTVQEEIDDGAEDPRAVVWRDSLLVIYHNFKDRQMWLYDEKSRRSVKLSIRGHATQEVEKNWSPLVIDNKDSPTLHLVYSHNPLVILKYDVDAGDGVCDVVFGSVPMRVPFEAQMKMLRPVPGGTPFRELSFEDNPAAAYSVRTFLSFSHTRKVRKKLITKGRRKLDIFRPIPVLLHMVCDKNRDEKGCQFRLDVFDPWYDVESPDDVWETVQERWRRPKSVSYPYDLQVFPENNRVRMGIEFEDCFSEYRDFEVDFASFQERHQHYSNKLVHTERSIAQQRLLELKGPSVLGESKTSDSPSMTFPMATEQEVQKYLSGHVWVVSHGGVSSEYFRSVIQDADPELNQDSQTIVKSSGLMKRPMEGVVAHFPFPPSEGPTLCIYLFGSVYESILSQLRRHPDNPAKLHNDEMYPRFSSVEELLKHPAPDPFGISDQFFRFSQAQNTKYPIILVHYESLKDPKVVERLGNMISNLSGKPCNLTSYQYRERSSSLDDIPDASLRNQFARKYAPLKQMFDSQPPIQVISPAKPDPAALA